jgi:glutamate/tyrosine decarboxylase-like PLP-dependent enzyme
VSRYRKILHTLRDAFPQPESDLIRDAYLVQTVARALDEVDALKSEVPILGVREPLDYAAAKTAQLPESISPLEKVTKELVSYLKGVSIWGHSRNQINVVPPPTIPSLVGTLLAGLYNPNIAWDKYSHKVAVAEVEVVAITAALIGYDRDRAGGVFTFGGTGTVLYGIKVGLEKAIPGAMKIGVSREEKAVIFASDRSHYCHDNVAGWLGIGTDNLIQIPTNDRNEMDIKQLRQQAYQVLSDGGKIAGIICTMGTTDAFGIDNLEAVVKLRDELVAEFGLPYQPHVHADAVIGWAWSVFNDYPWDENPLGFHRRTIRALAAARDRIQHLHLADSVGIDFHKTGFTPYISSLVVFKDQKDLELLTRNKDDISYLYDSGEYYPGTYTLETSRSGGGVLAALANLRLFGQEGWQATIGHLIEMTELLRDHLGGYPATTVLNDKNYGPVTLFRVYPDGVDTFNIQETEFNDSKYREQLKLHNDYNRRIYEYIDREAMSGRGVLLSWTKCYRHTTYDNGEPPEPVPALKSYILSPFVDEKSIQAVVEKVLEARKKCA